MVMPGRARLAFVVTSSGKRPLNQALADPKLQQLPPRDMAMLAPGAIQDRRVEADLEAMSFTIRHYL